MLFARKGTTEDLSAKKKARQEKWWVFPVVLLLCVLICAAGAVGILLCYGPLTWSDADVDAYVSSIYGDSWALQKKGRAADGKGAAYHYAQENGDSFTVFTVPVPVYRNGVASGRYRKALYDNYFSTVIEKKLDALEELAEKYRKEEGPDLEIEENGESAGAFGAQYTFCLYLERSSQLEDAARLLSRIDRTLAFSCAGGEAPYAQMRAQTPCVEVFLKPDGWLAEGADAVTAAAKAGGSESARRSIFIDWRSIEERNAFRISRISLTDAESSSRLAKEDVQTRLENDYVDAAKTFGKDYYSISEELWNKYPAPVLTLINAGGYDLKRTAGSSAGGGETDSADVLSGPAGAEEAVSAAGEESNADKGEGGTSETGASGTAASETGASPEERTPPFVYQFVYHRSSGTYWMTGLDPCEDFDGNPYGNYPRRGAFSWLVKCLGGSFTADRWSGSWQIGTTRWEASLATRKAPEDGLAYKGMTVYCDGSRTPLDAVPAVLEGTGAVPAGRPYSIRDLIRMLDVRITINQREMTAVMFRDYSRD